MNFIEEYNDETSQLIAVEEVNNESLLQENSQAELKSGFWYLDTSAGSHITNERKLF